MKKLFLLLVALPLLFLTKPVFADVPCQVIYGGGEICTTSTSKLVSFPPREADPTTTPTPTPADFKNLSTTPSTGTNIWGLLLVGASGVAGVLILLL